MRRTYVHGRMTEQASATCPTSGSFDDLTVSPPVVLPVEFFRVRRRA